MYKIPYPGKFIVFEGLDGSGQSTQVKLLKNFLEEKKINALATKEPAEHLLAFMTIREVLDKKIKVLPAALQLLFCANRADHLDKIIIPALKQKKWVISDRYFLSTFAYGSLDLPLEWLIQINDLYLQPDIIFLLKVKPEICIERIGSRGEEITLFEKKEKLEKVWQTYKKLADRFKYIKIIDGEKSIDEVFESVKKEIEIKFKF